MDESLLSKKELLEHTGISYGQLYRWKRMNIIPENWFIKRSSFTGQETFFPKAKILERVRKIIELKDEYSLEELAKFFSPNPSDIELAIDDSQASKLVKEETIQLYKSIFTDLDKLTFNHLFFMYFGEILSANKVITLERAFLELSFIQNLNHKQIDGPLQLMAILKNQETIWLLAPFGTSIKLEDQASIYVEISLVEHLNELKIKLSGLNK
ncbi:DUF4004 family protein [Bacillus sp. DJP31]|uniref:DUF4004 family protein n=1 Tax=Bacillus sp. DJP31 TaxID=3409789 RepID=UPI003BB70E91